MFNIIQGGVTAPKGFTAGGIHCGIRKNRTKSDICLIFSETICDCAAVYTQNKVKAAPLYITMDNLKNGKAQAIICNSANANACAPNGEENALRMAKSTAKGLGISSSDVIVASTGVIGVELNIGAIESSITDLVNSLNENGSSDAAFAIMTTDLNKKEFAVSVKINGTEIKIGGIAKGSGMIHPNMGTMLSFITTDAAIEQELLQKALSDSTKKTYNRVSIDGDTSTNDMCVIMANGMADNKKICSINDDYKAFASALNELNRYLAREIAKDGEGATKLITCIVKDVSTEEAGEKIAKSVVSSSLVKAAMFGADANVGRVLCAMGYSGVDFSPQTVDICFTSKLGEILVCRNGIGTTFDEDLAKKVLSAEEVIICIEMNEGDFQAEAWGCDLTYDYVKINGDYRT